MRAPTIIRTYDELILLPTFEERFEYLRLDGSVGAETFGFDRYINQGFYKSDEWRSIRNFVITRDLGRDLGVEGYDINSSVYIHHMNPIMVHDIIHATDILLDPKYLISTSHRTHNAIHYGNEELLPAKPITRAKNDTCPWKH